MSCQFFIKAYYAVIIRFAFRKCWTWNKNGFFVLTFEWFSNIPNNRVEHEFDIFEHVFQWIKDGSVFFFWRESQKQTKFVVKDDTIYLWRKCFFKYNEKKIYKTFFSSLHTSGQAYMLFLTTPKNVRNLDSICPHI